MELMSEATGSYDKVNRVLGIYTKLISGGLVYKSEEAANYDVNERTIQRDIDDIRNYMEQSVDKSGIVNSVIFDREKRAYRLEQIYHLRFKNSEILAICKILLDSRAFTKKEMTEMLDKLIECCVPKSNQKLVQDLIRNEEYHYIEPHHQSVFVDKMWDIGQAIHDHRYIEIEYCRLKEKKTVKRKLQPVAIMFSEYYFYLTAFIEDEKTTQDFEVRDDAFPTIYRIDRIQSYQVLDEHYHIPYNERFEEGEFRKRVQFMYGGKLQKVKFKYKGESIEAVLDRLPTARILDEADGVYTVSAEVFGKGIDMWLRSQGDNIELIG
jgi:predicted DNA-binding transcriptional regulator YafY